MTALITAHSAIVPGSELLPDLGMSEAELAFANLPGLHRWSKYRTKTADDDVEFAWLEGETRGRLILSDLNLGPTAHWRTPSGTRPAVITHADGNQGLRFTGNPAIWLEQNTPDLAVDISNIEQTGYSKLLVIDMIAGSTGALHYLRGPAAATSLTDGGSGPSFAIGYPADATENFYLRAFVTNAGAPRLDASATATLSTARTAFLTTASASAGGVITAKVFKNGPEILSNTFAAPLFTTGASQIAKRGGQLATGSVPAFDYYSEADFLLDYGAADMTAARDDLFAAILGQYPVP